MTLTGSGFSSGQGETVHFEKERGVTDVQVTRGVAHATVELIRDSTEALGEVQLGLLQALAAASIPVFLIKLHPTGISFAFLDIHLEKTARVLKESGANHTLTRDLALVAPIAGAMRDLSGVMAAIYEAFVTAGIAVLQTSDAYNAVLCLIAGDKANSAVEALRDCFALKAAMMTEDGEPITPNPVAGSGRAL